MADSQKIWLAVCSVAFGLIFLSLPALAHSFTDPQFLEPTPGGDDMRAATEAELLAVQAEWSQSAHADTYDNGMGANTTCARCKSPLNWDPSQSLAQEEALDCYSCKRVPGADRPELESGISVAEHDWKDISCAICHIPMDDSYSIGIAYWNQQTGSYEAVANIMDLCAKCHEGQHGFEVVDEQEVSQVHVGMLCTDCHGAHGSPSACEDCHDPASGSGADEHMRHQVINCTACHDAGNLSVWFDNEMGSPHYGEYITRRFAHALTSWPSHNLQLDVKCERCHHPQGRFLSAVASQVSCKACHTDGAVLFWCENFPHDVNPIVSNEEYP